MKSRYGTRSVLARIHGTCLWKIPMKYYLQQGIADVTFKYTVLRIHYSMK